MQTWTYLVLKVRHIFFAMWIFAKWKKKLWSERLKAEQKGMDVKFALIVFARFFPPIFRLGMFGVSRCYSLL